MLDDRIKEVLKDHNRRLVVDGSIKHQNDISEDITYSPFFARHMITRHKHQLMAVVNGTLVGVVDPSEFNEGLIVGTRVGDPVDGGGGDTQFYSFPLRGAIHQIERFLKRVGAKTLRGAVCDLNEAYMESFLCESLESPYTYFSVEAQANVYDSDWKEKKINLSEIERLLMSITENNNGGELGFIAQYNLNQIQRYLVNSEGTEISDGGNMEWITLTARKADSEGRQHFLSEDVYFRGTGKLPTLKKLKRIRKRLTRKAEAIIKSPFQDSGHFPMILDGINSGSIFHEMAGHHLEGGRLKKGGETAHTFKNKLGERVAPPFITLIDDPTLKKFGETRLNGHYLYDDEGVAGQRTILFSDGVLTNYLHSRESAGMFGIESNGHSRSDYENVPEPRMSNLYVESSEPVPIKRLKQMLIEEVRRRDKPYGLWLKDSMGGFALPELAMFNTSPSEIFRIYPDGHEERVRGVYLVGTCLQTLEHIRAMSDDHQVFEGICGSGSGGVPTSQIAPSCYIESLEVRPIPNECYDLVVPEVY